MLPAKVINFPERPAAVLHSRDMHRKAQVMYANPDMFNPFNEHWTSVEKKVAVSKFSTKRKIEVLIANYPLA